MMFPLPPLFSFFIFFLCFSFLFLHPTNPKRSRELAGLPGVLITLSGVSSDFKVCDLFKTIFTLYSHYSHCASFLFSCLVHGRLNVVFLCMRVDFATMKEVV